MSKTILITGSSSGIGEACANLFAEKGWNVVATMRNPGKLRAFGNVKNVLVSRLDVQDIASIEHAVSEGVSHFGGIDVLLNNAGYGQYGVFEAVPREKVLEQFEVNVFGPMDVIRVVLPVMRSTEAFSRMSAARLIDSGDVARVVYEAATDGSDRLRYLVGNDTRGFIKARAELADQEYVDFLRSHFSDAIGKT